MAALALVLLAAWVVPLSGVWQRVEQGQTPTTAQSAGLVVLLALLSCVGTYFSAALLHSVHGLLAGGRPAIGTSLRSVAGRLPTLVGWSALGSTLGLLLRVLESTVGLSLIFELAGLSWSLLTFFVLPVIVVEGGGLLPSLRRSLLLGRRELGSWVAGGVRLFVTTVVVLLAGVSAMIVAVESDSPAVMFAAAGSVLTLFLLAGILSSAVSGAYRMTLYHRAVTDRAG
ncbi:DUF6159 family protein [Kitasatospora mediocidica]|uniref:DUF6159 family protein n=1 Tax=Kitasatospora mediocidica TaxID=58352 RepID=UPI00055C1247|nr:DUF6159 family protein [Kitasatospora mediocidica]